MTQDNWLFMYHYPPKRITIVESVQKSLLKAEILEKFGRDFGPVLKVP